MTDEFLEAQAAAMAAEYRKYSDIVDFLAIEYGVDQKRANRIAKDSITTKITGIR